MSGNVSWTITGLPTGNNVLTIEGFTVAAGQPGGQEVSANVSIAVPSSTLLTITNPKAILQSDGVTVIVTATMSSDLINAAVFNASGTKIGTDQTPAGGGAVSWTITGLPAGSNVLTIIGFTVVAGGTGGSSTQTNVTVNVTGSGGGGAGTFVQQFGCNNVLGWGVGSLFVNGSTKVPYTRQNFGDGTSLTQAGFKVLPIAGLATSKSAQQTQIASQVASCVAAGIPYIELGNENYAATSGVTYGALVAGALAGAAGTNVKILIQATSAYYAGLNGGSGNWFNDVKSGLLANGGSVTHPNLGGWTIHPYPGGNAGAGDSLTAIGSDLYGWPMVTSMPPQAVAAGWPAYNGSPAMPWYITEFGYANGFADTSGLNSTASAVISQIKNSMPWVAGLWWYSAGSAGGELGAGHFGITTVGSSSVSGTTTNGAAAVPVGTVIAQLSAANP